MKDQKPEAVATVPRPRGRPRVEEPLSTVSVRLPLVTHDRLIELAKQHEQSISKTVRQLLILRLE